MALREQQGTTNLGVCLRPPKWAITIAETSDWSKEVFTVTAAAEASRDVAPPVDLVDGNHLCDLLVEHGIGVKVHIREVRDVTVELDAI